MCVMDFAYDFFPLEENDNDEELEALNNNLNSKGNSNNNKNNVNNNSTFGKNFIDNNNKAMIDEEESNDYPISSISKNEYKKYHFN